MKKFTKIILVAILFCFAQMCFGQAENTQVQEEDQIKLITKDYGDKHVLRWGFTSPKAWYFAMKEGVEVFQLEMKSSGTEYTKVADVKPMDEETIELLASKELDDQDMLVIVLQNIHREWENSQFEDTETIIEKSDNFINRYSFVHFAADKSDIAADAAGLRYETSDFDPEKKYAYKVVVKGRYPSSDLSVLFPSRTFTPLLYDIQEHEGQVVLRWDRSMHENKFSAYYIEQSQDGKNFERLLDIPYVQMFDASIEKRSNFYTYSQLVENDKDYAYRIIGIDAFGDESPPSPIIFASGKDRTPPPKPRLRLVKNTEHLQVQLEWEQDDPGEVVNYYLEHTKDGEKQLIADFAKPTDRQKIFPVEKRGLHSFRLLAIDDKGNIAYSDEYYSNAIDIYPPSPPTGLTAVADSSGVVTLIWDQAVEDDVVGYYIFSADANDRSFKCLNSRSHSYVAFVDTLNLALLNEEKYYKVVAIDSDGMRSSFSEEVMVEYPDIIPPAPALIADYKVAKEFVELDLRPSSSRDVVEHVLERREVNGEEEVVWVEVFRGVIDRPKYQDAEIGINTKYEYRFYAIDDAGLKSKIVKTLTVKSKRKNDVDLGIQVEQVGEYVTVTWDENLDLDKIILFKKVDDGPFETQKISTKENSFKDAKVKLGSKVSYRFQGVQKDGFKLPMTEVIVVQL